MEARAYPPCPVLKIGGALVERNGSSECERIRSSRTLGTLGLADRHLASGADRAGAASAGAALRDHEPGLLREARSRADRRPAFQELVSQAQQKRSHCSFVVVYDVERSGHLDKPEEIVGRVAGEVLANPENLDPAAATTRAGAKLNSTEAQGSSWSTHTASSFSV